MRLKFTHGHLHVRDDVGTFFPGIIDSAMSVGLPSGLNLGADLPLPQSTSVWHDLRMRDFLIPLGTVIAAVIVSTVAARASRTTPHERLTALIAAVKDIPAGLDTQDVLDRAIVQELADIEARLQAEKAGHWQRFKNWSVEHPLQFIWNYVGAISLLLLALGIAVQDDLSAPPDAQAVIVMLTGAVSLGALGAWRLIAWGASRDGARVDFVEGFERSLAANDSATATEDAHVIVHDAQGAKATGAP